MLSGNGLTAADIAARVGVSERAVRKRSGLDAYQIATVAQGTGRPVTLYRPEVLSLWRTDSPATVPPAQREHRRADLGLPRRCSAAVWEIVVRRVRSLYQASAQSNLRLACEQAERELRAAGYELPITHKQIYKRLTCRNTGADGLPISEYYRENWDLLRRSALRKHDMAKTNATSRYDWLSIFEDAGLAGAGYGALRGWSIDVRKADAWASGDEDEAEFPTAIYIRDVLTGMPLHVHPIESETSEAIIRAVLICMLKWRRAPDLLYAIDNGRSMIAERTLGVLASTLPESAWELAANLPELFGRRGDPILRNLPNIPRSKFKAGLERSFKQIKDEHDATRHFLNYQGGDRSEAVQLRVSNRPAWQYMPTGLMTSTAYFSGLEEWMYSDYIRRERPAMFPLFVERGITPTIETAFQYYYDPTPALPSGERLAHLLYWSTAKPARAKAELGWVDVTIDGRFWHCLSPALDHRYYGHKVAVLPIPGSDHAVLMLADNPSDPRYIDTGRNGYVRTVQDLREVPSIASDVRNTIRERLREERSSVETGEWRNTTGPASIPTLPGEAWVDGEVLQVEDVPRLAEPQQNTGDVDDLLRRVDDLLG